MDCMPARMLPTRLIINLGALLCLLLVIATDARADEPAATTTEPGPTTESTTPALPPVPGVPMAVPNIPAIPAEGRPAVAHEEFQDLERQIADKIARSFDAGHQPAHHNAMNYPFNPDLLIPLFAIFFIFGGPVILIIAMMILHYRAKARRQRQQSENIAQLLAAGRDVPLELLRGEEASSVLAEENLRKGVKNIGVGTGLLIFLTLLAGVSIGAVGFIMIGLGISQLVVWKLADNKNAPRSTQD